MMISQWVEPIKMSNESTGELVLKVKRSRAGSRGFIALLGILLVFYAWPKAVGEFPRSVSNAVEMFALAWEEENVAILFFGIFFGVMLIKLSLELVRFMTSPTFTIDRTRQEIRKGSNRVWAFFEIDKILIRKIPAYNGYSYLLYVLFRNGKKLRIIESVQEYIELIASHIADATNSSWNYEPNTFRSWKRDEQPKAEAPLPPGWFWRWVRPYLLMIAIIIIISLGLMAFIRFLFF